MAQQQQQQSGDHSMAGAWIAALLMFAGYGVWVSAHQYIVSLIFAWDLIQAKLINFFYSTPTITNDILLIQTLDPKLVNWTQLMSISSEIGSYSRYPLIFILIILGIILYKSDITARYRRKHSMNSLREQEQQNWPAIMPVVKENLIDADINHGPWAMALSPLEFSRKHQLLKKTDVLLDSATPGLEMTAAIRRADAKRVFTMQLGPFWEGFERCPLHVRALGAVFMSRIHRDKNTGSAILKRLDESYVAGQLDPGNIDEIILKYQNTELVQDVFSGHAYLLTMMASLLEAARSDGVVPSAEFLWLRVVDRRLWYMLNCVGRQTPFAEVAGPFAHWKAEQTMRRPSRAPMIDEAIKALEIAVREVKLSSKELESLEP